ELPSPVAGRLAKILVQVDQTVAVGADIALIEENADVSASPPAQAAPGPDAAAVKSPVQAETPVIENEEASISAGDGATARESHAETEERQRISPLARRLAREHDVDLNAIAGTGTGGRVRKEDILAYVQQRQASVATARPTTTVTRPGAPAAPEPALEPQPAFATPALEFTPSTAVGEGDVEIVTPSRMRLAIAEHMVRSKRTSPHATTVVEVDMTNIA